MWEWTADLSVYFICGGGERGGRGSSAGRSQSELLFFVTVTDIYLDHQRVKTANSYYDDNYNEIWFDILFLIYFIRSDV